MDTDTVDVEDTLDLTDAEAVDAQLIRLDNIRAVAAILALMTESSDDPVKLHSAIRVLAEGVDMLAQALQVALAE